jgi:hypothetical protein
MSFNLSIEQPLLLGMRAGCLHLAIKGLEAGVELLVRAECSTLGVKPQEGVRCTATQSGTVSVDFWLVANESKRKRHELQLTFDSDCQSISSMLEVEQVNLESLDKWETIKLLLAEFFRKPWRVLVALAPPALLALAVFTYQHWPPVEPPVVRVQITVNGRPQNEIKTYLQEFPNNAVWTDKAGEAQIPVKSGHKLKDDDWVCVDYPSAIDRVCNRDHTNQPFKFRFP